MRIVSALALLSLGTVALPAAHADLPACGLRPACNDAGPSGSRASFRHLTSRLFSKLSPRHRARDLFVRSGGPAVVVAKFAYGPFDKDLEDEDVEVWVNSGCSGRWSLAGVARTTKGGAAVPQLPNGTGYVSSPGGRVYFDLTKLGPLALGKHRVKFVVRGDGSSTNAWVEVVRQSAKIVVTDLDGTQTSSEWAALGELVGMKVSPHPMAPQAMQALAQKGYYIYYLSARPEWFMKTTRQWLDQNGYPPGLVRITSTGFGANGKAAAQYKIYELKGLQGSAAVTPVVGIGNRPSDVTAYRSAGLDMGHTYYYQLKGDVGGGHDFDSYQWFYTNVSKAMPAVCR